MLESISYDLIMDRKVEWDKHYISPGGFSVKVKNKHKSECIDFDFLESCGYVNDNNKTKIHYVHRFLDTEEYPDAEMLNKENLKSSVFSEFFVFTGEDEEPEIHPVKVENLRLEFSNGESLSNEDLLENETSLDERATKALADNRMNEIYNVDN